MCMSKAVSKAFEFIFIYTYKLTRMYTLSRAHILSYRHAQVHTLHHIKYVRSCIYITQMHKYMFKSILKCTEIFI